MKVDLNKIINKFYKTEHERLERVREFGPFIDEMQRQIDSFLVELHAKGYRLSIFDMRPQESILYAALTYCCGQRKNEAVQNDVRNVVYETITSKTRYKNIVWEDLKQLGEAK